MKTYSLLIVALFLIGIGVYMIYTAPAGTYNKSEANPRMPEGTYSPSGQAVGGTLTIVGGAIVLLGYIIKDAI